MTPHTACSWPTLPADTDARTALSVLLREGTDALTLLRDGQPVGELIWSALRDAGRAP